MRRDNQYRNSRLISYNRWSEALEVKRLVGMLVAEMTKFFSIKKLDGYGFNMRTLLVDLYHSHLTDKDQYIAYYRKKDDYKFKVKLRQGEKDHRYNKNPHISHIEFTRCVDYLTTQGYIEHSPGRQFRDNEGGSYGYLSRIKPTAALVALWEQYKFSPEMITNFKPDEVIILRGKMFKEIYYYNGRKKIRKVKPLIADYRDTPKVVAMRNVVEDYNLFLERTHIDVDVDCMSQTDKDELLARLLKARDKTRYTINLSSKQVYRVFNNGSFKQGGRFYGAWWIGSPSIIRKYITIDGQPTAELDYSGIHINLLYALKGINFAELDTDPYKLVDNDPDRELNKLILLTAYNAEDAASTAKAVFNDARMEGTLQQYGLKEHKQVIEKLDLLKQKHQPIEEYVARDFGRTLQYHDSTVIASLIQHFTHRKIPILTVHDSVICQRQYEDLVLEKMKELYTSYINKVFQANIKYQRKYPEAKLVFTYIKPSYQYKAPYTMSEYNPILGKSINYKGRIPANDAPVIKVKTDTIKITCSRQCNHYKRWSNVQSGKRIFLGKIKIEYETNGDTAKLVIKQ